MRPLLRSALTNGLSNLIPRLRPREDMINSTPVE
jgi:hypothetical protein